MAGLIPQRFIDDLLGRVDIVDVIGSRLSLKKTGKNYSACCPFHKEKTPSFSVAPDKQFYHCFGCGVSGNALRFLMEYEHLDFPQAVEELARSVGLDVPHEESVSSRYATPKPPSESPLYSVLAQAAAFYQQTLKHHPARTKAIDYLKSRGITGVIARDFGLGFAPHGWENLRQHLAGDDTDKNQQLIDAGLLIDNAETGRRYDRFRDRIMFPIRDTRGRVIGFGGRVLGDEKPKYLNSPETPVFHKGQSLYGLYEARQQKLDSKEIIVVEGYMDVIALAQQGFTNAVATLGTATSEEHVRLIFRSVPNILFCFDGDKAGRTAAWRALEACLPQMQDGRRVRFLFLPEGEDPDSLVRHEGYAAFQERIALEAEGLADYFFRHLCEQAAPDTLEGKAHIASLAAPLLGKLPKGHFRSLMQQQLQHLTGLPNPLSSPPETINAAHGKIRVSPPVNVSPPREKASNSPRVLMETPAAIALRALLYRPTVAHGIKTPEALATSDDPYASLLMDVLNDLETQPANCTMSVLGRWHGTAQGHALLNLLEKEWLIDDSNLEQQFTDTITALAARQRENNIEQLLEKDRRGEQLSTEEKELLRRLLQRVAP